MAREVVGSMSEWAGVLSEVFRQIKDGSLTLEMGQAIIEHRNPFETPNFIIDWQNFYKEVFGIEIDLTSIRIPEKKKGFKRPLIRIPELTVQKLYDKCKELFPCWKWTSKSLDQVIDPEKSERKAENGPYLIWVRDRIEADRELKNLSAIQIQERKIATETFEERFLHELKFFKETGKHLDVTNITLCSGSRYSDGFVPLVSWSDYYGKLYVDRCGSSYAYVVLRAREVVS